MTSLKGLLLLFIVVLLCACSGKRAAHQHSFYYWKTTFDDDSVNGHKIKQLGVDHFYIRYMDVDWSEQLGIPVPVGELEPGYNSSLQYTAGTYTPVVFITNRTFERMKKEWLDTLAERLTLKISTTTRKLEVNAVQYYPYNVNEKDDNVAQWKRDSLQELMRVKRAKATTELQIDCDWTMGTRDKYFTFLKKMKALNKDKTISATIRLYPYKYHDKMGVPPVDKGMLMCYNLGRISEQATANSIFDIKEMSKYLDGGRYPLPLDIALPVFSWQAWFRGGMFKGIVHNEITDKAAVTNVGSNTFRINTDTMIGNVYYREGDELRLEAATAGDLVKAANIICNKVPSYQGITFFDWDINTINKYEKAIREVYTAH